MNEYGNKFDVHDFIKKTREEELDRQREQKDAEHRAWLRLCGHLESTGIGRLV